MHKIIIFSILIASLLISNSIAQTPGSLDNTFNNGGSGFNNGVYPSSIQSDGKIIVGGGFTTYNGNNCPDRLVRLNSDGSIDDSFNNGGTGFDGAVISTTIQSNGKIIVGGIFTTYNGNNCPDNLLRLNSDGSIDVTFNNGGSGFNERIISTCIQSDGKIIVGGNFTTYNGAECPDRLVRLNSDGSIDNTFNNGGSGFNDFVYTTSIQSDGKIIVGGDFTTYNGGECPDRLVRLNSNGSLDNTFNNGGTGFNNDIYSTCILSDGKIIVGGDFTTYNNIDCPDRLVRINSNGSIDNSFNSGGSGLNDIVLSIKIQNNGKIIVGGGFIAYNGNNNCPDGLVRLNSDGSIDNDFNINGAGFDDAVFSTTIQSDGKIIVGGEVFTTYNGLDCPDSFVRINGDATNIPTLPEWGLIVFGSLIAFFAVRKIIQIV